MWVRTRTRGPQQAGAFRSHAQPSALLQDARITEEPWGAGPSSQDEEPTGLGVSEPAKLRAGLDVPQAQPLIHQTGDRRPKPGGTRERPHQELVSRTRHKLHS